MKVINVCRTVACAVFDSRGLCFFCVDEGISRIAACGIIKKILTGQYAVNRNTRGMLKWG